MSPPRPAEVTLPQAGVSASTRLRLDADEWVLLAAVGRQLTAARVFDLPAALRRQTANDRVKVMVARFGLQSRYAGSICMTTTPRSRRRKRRCGIAAPA